MSPGRYLSHLCTCLHNARHPRETEKPNPTQATNGSQTLFLQSQTIPAVSSSGIFWNCRDMANNAVGVKKKKTPWILTLKKMVGGMLWFLWFALYWKMYLQHPALSTSRYSHHRALRHMSQWAVPSVSGSHPLLHGIAELEQTPVT